MSSTPKWTEFAYLRNLAVAIGFVIAISGCLHPCEVTSCTRTVKAVTSTLAEGGIQIDVQGIPPDRTTTLHHIYVQTLPASEEPECCWEVVSTPPPPKVGVKFPIQYGQHIEGMKTTIPARPLTKGRRYQITGWIYFVENGDPVGARIVGEFAYDGKAILLNK